MSAGRPRGPVRPIRAAPPARIRYPRIDAVWRAFATGTLAGVAGLTGSVAHADCALPQHQGTIDPNTTPAKIGPDRAGANAKGKADKRVRAVPVPQPYPVTGGVPARPMPPPERPPVPGGLMPVTVKPETDPVKEKPAPRLKQIDTLPQVDGARGSVQVPQGRTILVHAHGPDEPCHEGRTFVIRFDGEEPA